MLFIYILITFFWHLCFNILYSDPYNSAHYITIKRKPNSITCATASHSLGLMNVALVCNASPFAGGSEEDAVWIVSDRVVRKTAFWSEFSFLIFNTARRHRAEGICLQNLLLQKLVLKRPKEISLRWFIEGKTYVENFPKDFCMKLILYFLKSCFLINADVYS